MTVKMYCNYGTLAHEYNPVYAYTADDCADLVTVDIPDKYQPFELALGGYAVVLPLMGEQCNVDLKDALNQFAFFRNACTISKA